MANELTRFKAPAKCRDPAPNTTKNLAPKRIKTPMALPPPGNASVAAPRDLQTPSSDGTFTVVIRSGINQSMALAHALDFAVATAAFGRAVSLVLQGAGVWQLLNQPPHDNRCKRLLKQLDLFDLGPIYLCERSLNKYQLTPNHF
jgi:sulfur relay (sulfurtransferase) DsrF/TusC family protein